MESLPKPKHKYGYTKEQIDSICQELDIQPPDFWWKFGINTCVYDPEFGTIYYPDDVRRALYHLGFKKLGKNHLWD